MAIWKHLFPWAVVPRVLRRKVWGGLALVCGALVGLGLISAFLSGEDEPASLLLFVGAAGLVMGTAGVIPLLSRTVRNSWTRPGATFSDSRAGLCVFAGTGLSIGFICVLVGIAKATGRELSAHQEAFFVLRVFPLILLVVLVAVLVGIHRGQKRGRLRPPDSEAKD